MCNLGNNLFQSRYNLSSSAGNVRELGSNLMRTIKKYLGLALLGLVIVLTASINLFCVVVDNDNDGDPTTGVTVEFHVIQGKKAQFVTNLAHIYSPIAAKLFRATVPSTQFVERSADLANDSDFSSLIDLLGPPLRC